MKKQNKNKIKRSTTRLVALGFALIIVIGTMLLSLPISVRSGQNWTTFGIIVIFTLIQIGGLGFMTIGVYISIILKKKIGLKQRENLQESVNSMEIAGVVRLARKIVQGTFLIEGIGALLLSTRFIPRFGLQRGIAFSIFHAVSAFCNAGFDLMGYEEAYASLVSFEGDVLVNMVVMFLILTGGIGFIVWDDLMRNKWHFKKYLLHTKIVLTFTIGLTVIATIVFLVLENHGVLAGLTPVEKALGAAFCSVTPRTAGFNTTDVAGLSNAGKLLTILLMFIGGSPGSTAGGAKTTTIVVLLLYAVAMIRNHEDINLFGRRLTDDVVKKANAVVVTNFMLAALAAVIIMAMQPFDMADVLLEVFSAINTVGMSTGITRDLNTVSRLILIVLMYCGRLGSLSFALVFAQKNTSDTIRLPQEKIIVG